MDINRIDQEKFIFASLFDITNRLQVLGDRKLKGTGITTRQWFLTLVIQQKQPKAPSIGECAAMMGTSHQNIRQLIKRLEKRGFLVVKQDLHDLRTQRLYLTQLCREFWDTRSSEDLVFINEIFNEFEEKEIANFFGYIGKLRKLINR
ncbi:MAG: MarR family transcriptional regulator [Spirochaetales bacterium]|nr:MarR family transcriptional regulator [Spirochaetales bacterium]